MYASISLSQLKVFFLFYFLVQYQLQQEPYLLFTGKFHSDPTYIALSPDGRTVAMSHSNTIALWNTVSKKCDQVMENVHYGKIVC